MIKMIKSYLDKLSFLKKLRLISNVIIIIPILFLEGFIIYSSGTFIREQQILEVEGTINRNILDIENRMVQCENSLRYLVSNYSLQEFLNTNQNKYLELNSKAKSVGPLLYNTLLANQYFSKIKVYSKKEFSVLRDLIENADDVAEARWYQDTLNTKDTLWWYEDGNFFITKSITNYYPEKIIGIVKIDIKEKLLNESFKIFNMPIQIELFEAGKEIYSYCNTNLDYIKDVGHIGSKNLPISNWQIEYRISEDNFSPYFHPRLITSMIIVIILLGMVWLAINISSKSLLKRLYTLIQEVKQVKDGNLDVDIDISAKDEIGELAISIDQMLKKIHTLINQVYKSELDKKNLELNLLQSKISPHFLYNNLSAINWIAIEKGEDQIYEITTLMATFYRTALNKGVNIDRLRVEVENIKAYIKLQLLAHENSFDVVYNINEKLLDCFIPIFIMQPLVENAIEHGIDQLRSGRGKIEINIYSEGKILIIKIKDNGKELYQKIGNSHLSEKDFGYGISNVNNRIKLLFGDDFGVRIYANSEGSVSQIQLKMDTLSGKS